MSEARDFDALVGDSSEFAEDPVIVMVDLIDGVQVPTVVPASLRRLPVEARAGVGELVRLAGRIHALQGQVDDVVNGLREMGVPWAGIGWATGLTGEGARQRWAGADG